MNISMVDLKGQYHAIKGEIDEAISSVLEGSHFIMGPDVGALEKEVAEYLGVRYAIGVGSGTEALHIALMACGICGDEMEVIVPTFTFIATSEVVSLVGAVPVFADIDERTYNISVEDIRKKITKRTRAIIPVHLYGQPAAMDEILALAKEHGLAVIEDCAQSMGAAWKGRKTGSLGDAGCLSFFPSKNLGGYGDGGMIVTNRDDVAEKAKAIRVHGSKKKYFHHIVGFNSRLDTLQAAILRVKLRHLEEWNGRRRASAALYDSELEGTPYVTPKVAAGAHHVYHQYTIRTPKREELAAFLKEKGIPSMIYYPLCLHLQEVYKGLGYHKGDMPEAEKAQDEVLSLPMCPELTAEKVKAVTGAMKEFAGQHLAVGSR
ncbi:MAG: DegT/DnrJ/EryC1/StrS family aminotransferase [Candidatus Eremiobacteraeota bacterium]|nr:DegT/DnrJ/EryC1/StrS family aminotransferase [Candidatus Eremiobacteraeota bacterium]